MPIPILDRLTPEFRELVETVERGLFTIAKTEMSRDEAIEIKQRITRPLGVLNSRFRLAVSIRRSNNAHPHNDNALTTER